MKRFFFLFLAIVTIAFSCTKESTQEQVDSPDIAKIEPLEPIEINAIINKSLKETGNFKWEDVDTYVLWSAVMNGGNILTVGYDSESFTEYRTGNSLNIKRDIVNLALDMESDAAAKVKNEKEIVVFDSEVINYIDLHVTSIDLVEAIRYNPDVRYAEPSGYEYFAHEDIEKSSSGCNNTPANVNPADYVTIAPNAQQSWTYTKHNIPQAWNYSTGSGITVGLIDTGVSDEQSLLGSSFNNGYSTGRFIQKYGTYVNSIWPWSTTTDGPSDKCGHGTLMAATIASPRNNKNLPVGVAYNCNLVAYRATSDVVLDGYHEKRGVSDALTQLANRSDVKVISMSIGHIFSAGNISDAIKYAYSKGKMIIAAGGTSTNFTNWAGVIFPASMSETIAVTGITDGAGYTECAVCHKGGKIDFTVIMQRANDADRTSVCLGFFENTNTYVGGSSVATATTAGIAALIWSKNPTWTRQQVLDKMKQSASFYPNRHSDFGWGSINALAAVQ
ncbi:MAG: S8 family serine peptidase [Bacteroidales bacterium]|jgi:subtilisin family serine protease|nr:S8 family serine peptidase [Bacteroidales bacterium]MDD4383729.1 S8 family serine peptidase [Bacteroidales bacterium]MDY0196260.1 S8 family serine peptidase [Tenuifilaceae bacterium]